MALLNLILAAILTALGLFDASGEGGDGSQGDDGATGQGSGNDDGDDADGDDSGSQGDTDDDSDSGTSSDDPQERRLTRENQSLRKRLRELEQKDKERTRAEMSELERVKAELAEKDEALTKLQSERKTDKTNSAIEKAARAAGFRRPDVALRLIDAATLEAGDDGTPDAKALAEAIAQLKADMPELVAGSSSSPANGASDKGGKTMTPEQASKLAAENPDEFNRLFDAKDPALMKALGGN